MKKFVSTPELARETLEKRRRAFRHYLELRQAGWKMPATPTPVPGNTYMMEHNLCIEMCNGPEPLLRCVRTSTIIKDKETGKKHTIVGHYFEKVADRIAQPLFRSTAND